MAYTRTFAQLSLAVQQLGQWENSSDITSDVLLQAINYALVRGFDLMVGKWADYYTLDVTFAIVAGTDSYVLATIAPNFYKLRHLDVSSDGTRYTRCLPHDLEIAHRYSGSSATNIAQVRYRMQGANLRFNRPPPAATGRIYYIPLPVQFASTADVTAVTFDVPVEEQLVVHLAKRSLLIRSDLSTQSVDVAIGELAMGLRTAGDARDAGQPFYLDPNGPPRDRISDDDEWWY